jgi:hypothetical protein
LLLVDAGNERADHFRSLKSLELNELLETREGVKATLGFINDTKRLKQYFGDVSPSDLERMDDEENNIGPPE